MSNILDHIEIPYVDCQTLLPLLSTYKNPRDYIARLVKKGELIRLKNGFFLIANRFYKEGKLDYPYEQIANLLYGPSYISLEWALSFYGFIPERVMSVTSVTVGSSKKFKTPIGMFTYRYLNHRRYSIGIDYKKAHQQLGGYLIASPEKALADWMFFTSKDMTEEELLQDLVEARRIEKERLQALNQEYLSQIAHQYHSSIVETLSQLVRHL